MVKNPELLLVVLTVCSCHDTLAALFRSGAPQFTPDIKFIYKDMNVEEYQDNDTAAGGYYRHLYVDGTYNRLFIGARNYLYAVNISNISQTVKKLPLPVEDTQDQDAEKIISDCNNQQPATKGLVCHNHIRHVNFVKNSSEVFLCGTNSKKPIILQLDANTLEKIPGSKQSGYLICPDEPNQNTTVLWTTTGNPYDVAISYSTVYLNGNTPSFVRPKISVEGHTDVDSLVVPRTSERNRYFFNDGDEFSGSFDTQDYVYFFFHETDVESESSLQPLRYPRIARACKNDRGGSTLMKRTFTTFQKTRVVCSTTGDNPIIFSKLWDFVKINNIVYGIFSTRNVIGQHSSALCQFNMIDLDNVWNGPYKANDDEYPPWGELNSTLPKIERGNCPMNTKIAFDQDDLNFMNKHFLMYNSWEPQYSGAIFRMPNIIYQKITSTTVSGYRVFFLATNQGEIHKVIILYENNIAKSHLLARFQPFAKDNKFLPIWSLKYYNGWLYAATDEKVVQMDVAQCSGYLECTGCVVDPYCGWNVTAQSCQDYHKWSVTRNARNLMQNITAGNGYNYCIEGGAITTIPKVLTTSAGASSYVQLKAPQAIWCPNDLEISWFHGKTLLKVDGKKYHVTNAYSLMLTGIELEDEGNYTLQCLENSQVLQSYYINVKDCDVTSASQFQRQYSEWCQEFEQYKHAFQQWQQKYSSTGCNEA